MKINQPNLGVPPPERPKADRSLPDLFNAVIDYAKENEAPDLYWKWAALSMISGAVGRRVWMRSQYYEVHSNMYIVLVGTPAMRKGAPLSLVRKVLRSLPFVTTGSQSTSPEALIKKMSRIEDQTNQAVQMISLELGSLLKDSSQQKSAVDLYADLYDCHVSWDKETMYDGIRLIHNPWLGILAATTPQWLGDNLTSLAVDGGFMSRVVAVYEDERKLDNPWPAANEQQDILFDEIVNDVRHVASMRGEIKFTPPALAMYADWYRTDYDKKRAEEVRLGGYVSRKHIHVLKAAMAFLLATDDSLQLTVREIERALKLLKETESKMAKAFSGVGKNPLSSEQARILRQIQASPNGIEYKRLVVTNYHAVNKQQLDSILEDLGAGDLIKREGRMFYPGDHSRNGDE